MKAMDSNETCVSISLKWARKGLYRYVIYLPVEALGLPFGHFHSSNAQAIQKMYKTHL